MTSYSDSIGPTQEEDASRVGIILGLGSALFSLALLFYFTRIYSRMNPRRNFGWDDFFLTLSMLCATCSYVFDCLSVLFGFGRHTQVLEPSQIPTFNKYILVGEPLWVWSLTFVKFSVACLLIRIQRTGPNPKFWNWLMGISMAYLSVSAIVTTILQLTTCQPLRMNWDNRIPGGKCRGPEATQKSIISTSVVFVFSDFLFSLLPIVFLVKIRRPLIEKIGLIFIMALGLFASVIGIFKLNYRWGGTDDSTWDLVPMVVCARVEQYVAIIAACIPTLKQLFVNTLQKIGINLLHTRDTKNSSCSRIPDLEYISSNGSTSLELN